MAARPTSLPRALLGTTHRLTRSRDPRPRDLRPRDLRPRATSTSLRLASPSTESRPSSSSHNRFSRTRHGSCDCDRVRRRYENTRPSADRFTTVAARVSFRPPSSPSVRHESIAPRSPRVHVIAYGTRLSSTACSRSHSKKSVVFRFRVKRSTLLV